MCDVFFYNLCSENFIQFYWLKRRPSYFSYTRGVSESKNWFDISIRFEDKLFLEQMFLCFLELFNEYYVVSQLDEIKKKPNHTNS